MSTGWKAGPVVKLHTGVIRAGPDCVRSSVQLGPGSEFWKVLSAHLKSVLHRKWSASRAHLVKRAVSAIITALQTALTGRILYRNRVNDVDYAIDGTFSGRLALACL